MSLLLNVLALPFGGVLRLLSILDPHGIQMKIVGGKPAVKRTQFVARTVFRAEKLDTELLVARIANKHIACGAFERDQLAKLYNVANGKFTVVHVYGAGQLKVPFNGISLPYDARKALGLSGNEEDAELIVSPASPGEREFYHMYLDRQGGASRRLTWYMFGFSLFMTGMSFV